MRAHTILVVDDDPDFRTLARSKLEAAGYAVVEASHGGEAINLLVSPGQQDPACILLDLQMPQMDGSELLRILGSYARLQILPVIVVSAHPPQRLPWLSRPLGWFVKPIDWPSLLQAVARAATKVP
jgi:CheY-like chemotaxis protein